MRDKNGCKENMRKIIPTDAQQKMTAIEEIFVVQGFVYTLGFFRINEILLGYFQNSIYFKKAQKTLLGETQVLSFLQVEAKWLF